MVRRRRFLDIALGSLSELSYAGHLARDLKLLGSDEWERFDAARTKAGKLTMGLYKAVTRQAQNRSATDG